MTRGRGSGALARVAVHHPIDAAFGWISSARASRATEARRAAAQIGWAAHCPIGEPTSRGVDEPGIGFHRV